MAIPELVDGRLPPGDWEATWGEIEAKFAYNFRRREILTGLQHVAEQLRRHGIQEIWVDGSFVTNKQRPDDADVVYMIPADGDADDWADVGPSRRKHMKQYHRVDLWRYPSPQPPKHSVAGGKLITIKEFFETDGDGNPRGLLHVNITEEGAPDDQE
ncbi:hypothetical protein GCM10009798_14140 [Nocardioides panacihumi]|uniref:Uncharacterized protein n=1 Tax=Nocardioides panacihumi TaxID=400774 RepID=A0ABP5C0T4_9ACTN